MIANITFKCNENIESGRENMDKCSENIDNCSENIENMGNLDNISIEEKFERLEELLDRLEDDETGLELSFSLYEEGVRLIRSIEAGIDKVEKRIKLLEEDGETL